MTSVGVDPREPSALEPPVGEPEPDWAEEIRRLRRARGDRLKELLAPDDEDERR